MEPDGCGWPGDSAHPVVPAGGYGMNTGVGDAVGLGWVLAAIHQGWGDRRLLDAYESERRSVAVRNRAASARHTLVRLAIKTLYHEAIHSQGWNGESSRRRLGREITVWQSENEADGIEFGYRYDASRSCAANRTPHQLITWTRTRPVRCPGPTAQPLPGRDRRSSTCSVAALRSCGSATSTWPTSPPQQQNAGCA